MICCSMQENILTANANNHGRLETEDSRVIFHVDAPCLVSLCSTGNVMGIDGPFQPQTSNFPPPVFPCSKEMTETGCCFCSDHQRVSQYYIIYCSLRLRIMPGVSCRVEPLPQLNTLEPANQNHQDY